MTIREWFKKILHKDQKLAEKQINKHKSLKWIKKFRYYNLWHFNQLSVASGFAAGCFGAFIPLPIEMLVAALVAVLIRGNIFIAITMTFITAPFTFIPVTIFIAKIGQLVTGDSGEITVPNFNWQWENLQDSFTVLWRWFAELGTPYLIGLPIVTISGAVLGFVTIYFGWGLIALLHKIYQKAKR